MRKKLLFSMLAVFLFVTGAFFIWKEKDLALYQIRVSGNQANTHLVETSIETPGIGYDAWKESHLERVQLAGYYSKDSEGAYWYHMKITGADPDTFDVYNDRYAHDKSNVYYAGNSDLYTIIGADATNFQVLGDGYAKDKSRVYFRGEELAGTDSETFTKLGPVDVLYAKDRNYVYRESKRLSGFDAQSFRVLEKYDRSPVFLADKYKVAIESTLDAEDKLQTKKIKGADPATFVALGGLWGKDKTHTFYDTKLISGGDPETFQVLGTNSSDFGQMPYAKDGNHVYYRDKILAGTDAESFRVVEDAQLIPGYFGEDVNSAYWDGDTFPKQDLISLQKGKIPSSAKSLGNNYYLYRESIYHYEPPVQAAAYFGLVYAQYSPEQVLADPATFQVLKNGYARDKEYVYHEGNKLTNDPDQSFILLKPPYSKTNNAVFLYNNAIEGALSDSFEILSRGYAKDAKSVFYSDKRVTGADSASFEVLGQGLSSDEDAWGGRPFYYNYAQDAGSIFCEASKLPDADPKTFILKGKNDMPQDKFHHYDGCEVRD